MNDMYAKTAVINDMHLQGYTEDFQLSGNELVWIQGKVALQPVDFSITERYLLQGEKEEDDDIILYGITAHRYQVRGILSQHCLMYPRRSHPLIIHKLIEMYNSNLQLESNND